MIVAELAVKNWKYVWLLQSCRVDPIKIQWLHQFGKGIPECIPVHCISKEHFSSVEIGVEKYHYLKFPMTTKLY